jgi:NADPH:quinone reductase-like Zn-dependent oxidoreductase
MKATVQDRYGAPERVLRLEERDRPPVGDDDVLIRVRATSVNTPALGAEVTGVSSTRNLALSRSLGADHVIDYTEEDFTRGEQRYDVMPRQRDEPPALGDGPGANSHRDAHSKQHREHRRLFAGLPRMARAAMMGRGSTDVQFVTCVVNRENLNALAALLESGDVKVVIDKVYPLSEAADGVAHMLGHHARGKVVIAV